MKDLACCRFVLLRSFSSSLVFACPKTVQCFPVGCAKGGKEKLFLTEAVERRGCALPPLADKKKKDTLFSIKKIFLSLFM